MHTEQMGCDRTLTIIAYGVRVLLRANDQCLLDKATSCLPPGWKPILAGSTRHAYTIARKPFGPPSASRVLGPQAAPRRVLSFANEPGAGVYALFRGRRRLLITSNREELFEGLEADLNIIVAAEAPNRLFVHAGAVAWKGAAIVVPGRSFSGKSELVHALVNAGATYYSDEYTVLDENGDVHAFPRAISLRRGARGRRIVKLAARQIGSVPVSPRLLVVCRYCEGAEWTPESLTPGAAMLELLSDTVAVRRKPRWSMSVLSRVATRAVGIRALRGEARNVAHSILSLAEQVTPA